MIELPEAITLSKQLNKELTGKKVKQVLMPTYEHKFTWFHDELDSYNEKMTGKTIVESRAFGIYVEIYFNDNLKFNFNDGVNVRFIQPEDKRPNKYQLLIDFTDGTALVFTVAMYGGFSCYYGSWDNPYYQKSLSAISPLDSAFSYDYFLELFNSVKPTISTKAFLATEQRIPGVGNGVLQDILFVSKIHPKRKIETLSHIDKEHLYKSLKSVLNQMTELGGRDTEKDLYGSYGGYQTLLSKKTIHKECPCCKGVIEKKAFLGGSVYYCISCQPL